MNPNWAYPVNNYSDEMISSGMTCAQLKQNFPNQWDNVDGPDFLPNLVTESQGVPASLEMRDAVTNMIYLCDPVQYVGSSPGHPPTR